MKKTLQLSNSSTGTVKTLLVAFLVFAIPFFGMSQNLQLEATSNKTDILTGETLAYTFIYKCAEGIKNCSNVTLECNVSPGVIFPAQTIALTSDIESYTISTDRKSINFIFREQLVAGRTGIITVTGQGEFGMVDGSTTTLNAQLKSGTTVVDSKTVGISASKWKGLNTNETTSPKIAQNSIDGESGSPEIIFIPFTIKKIK